MDMQTRSDWPSIQTQPVPRFQLVHKGLGAHMRTNTHKNTQTRTHTQSPSVTSLTSALGLEECLVDRWCNNVILWIRVINVGHIGWYLCFHGVKHTEESISSSASGITCDIYMYMCVCDGNLEESEKNEMGQNVICLWSWETYSAAIIEISTSPHLHPFPILLPQLSPLLFL